MVALESKTKLGNNKKTTETNKKHKVEKVVVKKQESESSSDDSSEEEDETPVIHVTKKVEQKVAKVKSESEKSEDEEEDDDEPKMKVHTNGYKKDLERFNNAITTATEVKNAKELQSMASDVKSKETAERGDFKHFNLPKNLVEKLKEKGVQYLYPIQIATLEHIRAGHDVIAQARTGTGKTLAFAIPIVEKLEAKKQINEISKSPKVLVMEPTRELAKQVGDDFQAISSKLRTCCVYGGQSYERQESDLRKGVDILAGTPGRISDFINSGRINLAEVDYVILDEVDRMLDMGFQDSVEDVLKSVFYENRTKKAQTLFFSATCPPWVRRTAQKFISDDFKFVDLIGDSKLKTADTVEHLAIQCSYHDRASAIGSVLQVYSGKHGRAMIFCQTKKDADELACSNEIKQESHVLHGDIPQDKRELVLQKFRDGKYRVLITTDVAARGLDIPEVDLVVCCSPPKDYESYVHRSGRTGRAGRTGVCICFYKPQELGSLIQLERNTGTKFKRVGIPTASDIIEASTNDAAKAIENISEDLIEKFRSGAEEVLKHKDAVSALAAALAVISGCTKVTQRSLLSSRENLTTYILSKTDEEIRGKSFVYVIMRKIIGDNAEQAVQQIRFTKDKKGLVFDLSSEYDETIQEKWFSTKSLEMKVCTELPELEEEVGRNGFDRNGGGRSGGGSGGFRNGRGGGDRNGGRFGDRGGRGGRGGGGGFNRDRNGGGGGGGRFGGNKRFGESNGDKFSNKRKFDQASAAQAANNASKKIKFDD